MRNGVVNVQSYSSTWPTNQKSPLIWAPSAGTDLKDLSIGYLVDNHFDHDIWPATTPLTLEDAGINSNTTPAIPYAGYTTTVIGPALSTAALPSGADHVMLLIPGSTASLAGRVAIETRPFRTVTPGGDYVIFETCIGAVNAGAVQGMFVGLTTSTGLGSTAATTILKTVSGTANSNQLFPSTGAIGFWMHGDTPNNFDAVYQNQYSNGALSTANLPSTAAASISSTVPTIVLSNVLTASTFGGDPGNVYQQPTTSWGVLTSTACVKLGVYYNVPSNQVIWTVNGYQVASAPVTSALFDVVNDYGAILVYGATQGNGTISTGVFVDFFSAAAKIAKA